MSVTQYIGPLVGPVFADPAEWTSTRSYEALNVVLHEGNSYTARQDVPVGVQITNEDYWLETGNYNAQLEAYRNSVLQYIAAISHMGFVAATLNDVSEFSGILDTSDYVMTFNRNADDNVCCYWQVVDNAEPNGMDFVLIGSKILHLLNNTNINALGATTSLSDISSYFNRAINNTTDSNRTVQLNAGIYNVRYTVEKPVDIQLCAINGQVTLQGFNAPIFHIQGFKFSNETHRNYCQQFDGAFKLIGTGSYGNTDNIGIIIGSESDASVYTNRWKISNVSFERFSIGLDYVFVNNYINVLERCAFEKNAIAIQHRAPKNTSSTNSGEEMIVEQTTFGNNGIGIYENIASAFNVLTNDSFDFNQCPLVVNTYSRYIITACHFEGNGANKTEFPAISELSSLIYSKQDNDNHFGIVLNGIYYLLNSTSEPLAPPICNVNYPTAGYITGTVIDLHDGNMFNYETMLGHYNSSISIKSINGDSYCAFNTSNEIYLFPYTYDKYTHDSNNTDRFVSLMIPATLTLEKVFDDTLNTYVLQGDGTGNCTIRYRLPISDISKWLYYGAFTNYGSLSSPHITLYNGDSNVGEFNPYWYTSNAYMEGDWFICRAHSALFSKVTSFTAYDSIEVSFNINITETGQRIYMPYIIKARP